MTEQNYYADMPWGWKDRLRFKLFPTRPCPLPVAPASYADVLHLDTVAVLDWLDRVRVLFTGRVVVKTRTMTENMIGKSVTNSVVYVALSSKQR